MRGKVTFGRLAFVWLVFLLTAHAQSPYSLIPTPVPETPTGPAWLMPVQTLDNNLPSWLQFNAQFRNRLEETGHIGYKRGSDVHDLTQLRLQVAIHPVWWLRLVGETQDAEVFFNGNLVPGKPPYQNRWDIRQAFMEVGADGDNEGWFDLIGGREMLSFGDERLIGPSDWLNQGRTFDVIRADIHHPGFRISLFASSVVIARDGVVDHHLEGNNLYGIYSTFNHFIPGATLEPYVLWNLVPANVTLSGNQGRGALDEVTAGARLAGKLPAAFSYDVQMALQRGSLGPYSIQSWAGHWHLERKFTAAGEPGVFVESNYATGAKNPSGRFWNTFDQIYPSSHNKLDFADQVGWKNIRQLRTGIEEKATRSLTLTQTWEGFWRDSLRDGLYNSAGELAVASTNPADGRYIGQEVDLIGDYKWRKTVELGFGYAHLFPGTFLNRTTEGRGFNYPFVFLEFYFTNVEDH